jgi:hypothetical protein
MIPLKQTPEEQQAGWADYCRRRNWARLSLLLVAVAPFFLRKMLPHLLLKLTYLSWISYALATLLFVGIAVFVVGAPLWYWAAWKCPKCGNRFAFRDSNYSPGALWFSILWRLAFSSRCAFCSKSVTN